MGEAGTEVRTQSDAAGAARGSSAYPEAALQSALILDHVADIFYTLDFDWRLTFINRAGEIYYGKDREAELGRTLFEIYPQLIGSAYEEMLAGVMRSRQAVEFETPSYVFAERRLRVRVFPIPTGVAVCSHEITPQSRSTAERNRQYQELRSVYDAVPLGIGLLDTDLRYVRVNATLAAINGVDAEAHVGRTVAEVVPECARVVEEHLRLAVETGSAPDLEWTGPAPSDPQVERSWVETIRTLRDDQGRVSRLLVTLADVTEQKRTEAALRAALEDQKVLFRELSHRVANGFQIMSAVLTLQSRSAGDPGAAEALRTAADRVKAMALVHRRLYRVECGIGRHPLDRYVRDLAEDLTEAYLPDGRVSVTTQAGPSLDTDKLVTLGMIAAELVLNAGKHGRGADGSVEVEVDLTVEDAQVAFSVRDHGPGPAPGFDPSAARGLGLGVARSQAARLGGTLHAEAAPGGGACFTVRFPLT